MSSIVLNKISFTHPNGIPLFKDISLSIDNQRTGLTGKNGSGKSTIAKIITGYLQPTKGSVFVPDKIAYLPQELKHLENLSIIELFSLKEKYNAFKKITAGKGTTNDFIILDNDWDLENRLLFAMQKTGIEYLSVERKIKSLSGGEKIRCLLASLLVQEPSFIILDEPTNHLDFNAREIIYNFVNDWKKGMLVISHDKKLLRLMDRIAELSDSGIKLYTGNYDFYIEQRKIENEAAQNEVKSAELLLKKNIEEKKQALVKQAKRTRTAAKRGADSGIPKILLNAKKNSGENTLSKLNEIHSKRIEESKKKLAAAKLKVRIERQIKIDLDRSKVPAGKIIVKAEGINYSWNGINNLWTNDLSFTITGAERVLLKGVNGSGKTTLMKLIRNELIPSKGKLYVGVKKIGILDQQVSVLKDNLTLIENLKLHSPNLPEHELRIRLGRFLFYKDDVYKHAGILSGGEKMRAGLACLLAAEQAPELIMLDEPTNNLDLESISEVISALNNFEGALLVVSHDVNFIEEIKVEREIELER